MARSDHFYFRSIIRRWKAEVARAPGRILLFSPYLTSQTAELVLASAARPERVEIHTAFRAENFVTSSSSIYTLIKLAETGYRLYDVKGLHAKILFIPERVATIGSQNLTTRGNRNQEATAVFTDPHALKNIEAHLSLWLERRQPISPEMLDEMAKRVLLLVNQFKALQKAAGKLDDTINELEQERREREERARKEREEQERKERLSETLRRIPTARRTVPVEVRLVSGKYSLIPTSNSRMTDWICGGMPVSLEKKLRYVCIIKGSGKFGWARIFPTRVSFIGNRVSLTEPVNLGGTRYKMELSALWEEGHLFSRNIRITLSDLYGAWLVKIDAWFTLEELETVDITPNLSVIFPDGPMALVKWIKSNEAEFKQKVLARALNPFRYTKNLFGVRPNKFLAEVNFIYNMRLAKVAGFYVLVVSVPPGL